MIPGLSSYAQTITGNPKLRVRAHPMTSTDGVSWVNIRPPLILADRSDHDRRLCDQRDEIGTLLCPACHRSEAVYACLYHEMSHIVSGSLDQQTWGALKRNVTRGLSGAPDSTKKYIESRLATRTKGAATIYELSNHLHPYLIGVLRATDDYVIESRAIAARPGVEEMLYYMQEQIMLLGMEGENDERVMWSEQPTEVQLPIALLVELHGWGLDGKFSDETIGVIRSDNIQALIGRDIPDVLTGFAAAIGFLGEFNRLGYLLADDQEQEEEQEDEQESEDSSDSDESEQDSDSGADDSDEQDSNSDGQSDDEGDSGDGTDDNSVSPDGGSEAIPDGGSGDVDSEPGGERGDRPGELEPDGDDPESERGGSDLSAEPGAGSGADDEKDDQPNESDEVNDGAESNSEPGDTDSGSGSGGDVDSSDSGSDSGDRSGNGGSGGTSAGARSGDDDDSSDSDDGEGNQSNGRATPEEIDRAMSQATGHEQNEKLMEEGYEEAGAPTHVMDGSESVEAGDDEVTQEDLEIAIIQAMHFDDISRTVGKVVIYRGDDGDAMKGQRYRWSPVEESVIAGTINRARRVFTDNELDKHVNNLKSGKLSARSLGARGWGDDRRVFRKKLRAEKDDYFVVIGMDVSGSTSGGEIVRIKRAGCAMADLLHRLGVPFAIYAHTTSYWHESIDQHMYELKSPDDLWDKKSRERLGNLDSSMGSLDGHNFEFYRKVTMRSDATKKICVYYTDGYIPETNHEDESFIMDREARLYKRMGIESLIVAVGTELRDTYGFDQVRLDDDADISKVLAALEKKLTRGRTYA